jgi:hypothetical protein
MSKALVIGGDRIEGIKQVLQAQGIDKIDHWTGRKPGDVKRDLPANVIVPGPVNAISIVDVASVISAIKA